MKKYDVMTEKQAVDALSSGFLSGFAIQQNVGTFDLVLEGSNGRRYWLAQVRGLQAREFKTMDAAHKAACRIGFSGFIVRGV